LAAPYRQTHYIDILRYCNTVRGGTIASGWSDCTLIAPARCTDRVRSGASVEAANAVGKKKKGLDKP
jgi:hypothetical protein